MRCFGELDELQPLIDTPPTFLLQGGVTYQIVCHTYSDESISATLSVEKMQSGAIRVDPGIAHGSVLATSDKTEDESLTSALPGTLIALHFIPDYGYAFAEAQVKDASGDEVDPINAELDYEGYYTIFIIMPDSGISVSAVFGAANITYVGDQYTIFNKERNRLVAATGDVVEVSFYFSTGYGIDFERCSVTSDIDGSAVPFEPLAAGGGIGYTDDGEVDSELLYAGDGIRFTKPEGPVTVRIVSKLTAPPLVLGENTIMLEEHTLYSFTPTQSGIYRLNVDFLEYHDPVGASDIALGNPEVELTLLAGNTYCFNFAYSQFTNHVILTKVSDVEAWTVTVDTNTAHGSIYAYSRSTLGHEYIDLSYTAEKGYVLGEWIVTTEDGQRLTVYEGSFDSGYHDSFYLPEGQNVYVTAVFIPVPIAVPDFGEPDLTMPAALTGIWESAFEGDALVGVVDARNCGFVGKWAFKNSGLTQIRLPKDCAIDPEAFQGCGTVYIYAPSGGATEQYCNSADNCVFGAVE